ncbi:MAG TPA: NAD(P)/FAD-dependent oxidoreductase [Candidatus Limnocylindrales bacterium]|nr:NAD(P)/FAD-dependent oxidoreductase [Candidatus Limnocylindrales bacterium]
MEGFVAERYDAVIIGGGHNGLISAAYLARAGMRTLVLERRHVLGGAAVTEELYPGFRFSVFSYVVSLLRPEIIRELQLPRHGLDILPLDGTFTPLHEGAGPKARTGARTADAAGTGDYLWRVNDHGRTVRELRRWSATDAEAYEEYGQLMVEMARFIKPILGITPPDLTSLDPRPLLPLTGLLRSFQQLPERQQAVFVQLMTMSAADFLDQWFETDPLKATMSASGIIGTYLGVRSPGTAYVLLHHYMGEIDGAFRAWGIPKGGTGGISNAIGSAARALGAEIRTDAPVERILVRDGRAVGVALEGSGEEILAEIVLSSVDARRTFLSLLEPGSLDAEFEDEIRRFKFRGSSGKVNMAVDRLPEFTCLPGVGEHLRGAISFSPSVDDMERAYDDAKYGRFSAKPYIDMIIPTLVDPTMAPPGKHVISCFVQYAPYKLAPELGTWDDQREAFGDAVVNRISEFAPGFKDSILFRNVQTPLDIERTTGLTEGNIFQGELTLEQLFFNRPTPGHARFRTPVRDLWMCGSSTHPGGGIMGANGRIAALEVLRSRGRRVA